jgi:8-oxo-dGTP pyrophosphatase MutT (NUDIX family)
MARMQTCTAAGALLVLVFFSRLAPVEVLQETHPRQHRPSLESAHEVRAHKKLVWDAGRELNNQTVSAKTVASSEFAACQVRRVRVPSGAIVDNWLYFDERPHINLLVRLKADKKFVIFAQSKYATGETLAPVGGYIEQNESPAAAARRELLEELGLRTSKLRSLGSFVTSANRGGGRVFAFFADACVPSADSRVPKTADGRPDLESQRVVRLTRAELQEALLNAKFVESKWTATIALALLGTPEEV